MIALARKPVARLPVRVLVVTPEPDLEAHWRAIVASSGHACADASEAADMVLAIGQGVRVSRLPVIVITDAETGEAGALARDATIEQVDAAIRAVACGLLVRSPQLAPPGFAALEEQPDAVLLTPRELEVLDCIGEGLTNKLIARRLDISLHTVKFHIESVLRKLGVTTRAQAVAVMLERGRSNKGVRLF